MRDVSNVCTVKDETFRSNSWDLKGWLYGVNVLVGAKLSPSVTPSRFYIKLYKDRDY